ncbi:unnamed protein product [Parnassius apollo]|uniref:(apollo) hypothetical protein n=1 Tax=Parnassius apollo TaxID=110799 RepID=A0A8S3Y3Q3_PARAO|nr:unnamed protein product [Parnassius apollo]
MVTLIVHTLIKSISEVRLHSSQHINRAELASNQPKKPRPRHDLFNTKLGKHQLEQITIALIDKFTDYESNTKEFGTLGRYNWIENTIKTQIQLITNTKAEPKKWLTTNTKKLLEARNHLISTKDTHDRRKKLTEISKQIKDSIRKDRKLNRMETIKTFISKTGGIKKAYRELRNSKNWIVKMKNDSGKWNHRRTGILDIATSYYKRLYESNTTEDEIDLVDTSNIPNILQAEVEKAIDTQKIPRWRRDYEAEPQTTFRWPVGTDSVRNENTSELSSLRYEIISDVGKANS